MSTPTPDDRKVVSRYDPVPSSMAPSMDVAVNLGFVRSCPECREIAASLAATCIADGAVTVFRAIPGKRHCHVVPDAPEPLSGRMVRPSENMGMAENALFPENALAAMQEPNGFDPQGRS